jgi:hypothetical protein
MGLVHELVDSADELLPAARAWIESVQGNPMRHAPVGRKDYKMPGGTPSQPQDRWRLVVAPAMLKTKTRGLYPAPDATLAAMVEGAQVDFDTAMRIESRYLAKPDDQPGGEEHDQHVLLQPERDQERAVAARPFDVPNATSRKRSASSAPA